MPGRRRRAPVFDRTIRTEPISPLHIWDLSARLLTEYVVVYMPKDEIWKRGYLLAIVPGRDVFRIRWTRYGKARNQKGIWRVHPASLFSAEQFLPVPLEPATIEVAQTSPKEGTMATRGSSKPKPKAKPKAKPRAKQVDEAPAARTRTDKLAGLSEARRRNIAKLIFRERSKSPSTSWTDIAALVEEKYDWTLPGSMTGRRLLRDYGPDNAEDAIIKQNRENGSKKSTKAAAKSKKKAKDEEELEDEEYEDEVDEDEEEVEDEYEEDDEDEDEDEDEEEEPQPRRRVRVSRSGRGRKS